MKTNSPYYDEQYDHDFNLVESFVEFHPEELELLSLEDRRALQVYYLVEQEINVADVYEYRATLVAKDPSIEARGKRAFLAYMKALIVHGIEGI